MNNLINTILTNVADKLLSRILPEDNAAAFCWRTCYSCVNGWKDCKERCCGWLGCRTTPLRQRC
ncbi:hypothetical protein GS682_03100 [Nostoc sp. B(2019)]|nr:hypothetical protein [Nostoc sp. B(2019)]